MTTAREMAVEALTKMNDVHARLVKAKRLNTFMIIMMLVCAALFVRVASRPSQKGMAVSRDEIEQGVEWQVDAVADSQTFYIIKREVSPQTFDIKFLFEGEQLKPGQVFYVAKDNQLVTVSNKK